MVKCDGFKYEQRGLNLNEEIGKQIFWCRMAPKLKKIDEEDKYIALKVKMKKRRKNRPCKKLDKNQ